MKLYQIRTLLVVLTLFWGALPAQATTLDDLVSAALAANPEVKASAARWEMFEQKARAAGTLDDPMLMLGIKNGLAREPLNLNRDMDTARVIGISQMVPFFGKRELMRAAATHEAEATRWEVEERKLELAAMVKENWYRLYVVDRSLVALERSIANLDDLVRFVETMYSVGQGRQADVLRVQLERSKMEEMRLALKQQRRSLEINLNSLLARPVETAVPVVDGVELTTTALDPAVLAKLADANRPVLRAMTARIGKAEAERALADREIYPDFTFSFEYMQRNQIVDDDPGYDMYDASVSFNLPVQHERRRAMIAEATAAQRMAAEEQAMTRNAIRQKIADLVAQAERDRAMASLYREGIVPQAGAAVESALSAYRAGKGEFMQVLDSRMSLLNVERDYYQAVAEQQMALALLEAAVGAPLPAQ